MIQKLSVHAPDAADIRAEMELIGLKAIPFSSEQAEICANLWEQAKLFGLSLADRFCLATGIGRNTEILRTDKVWQAMGLPIAVHVIR